MNLTEIQIRAYLERCLEIATLRPRGIGRPYACALDLFPEGIVIGEGHKQYLEGTQLIVHAERAALHQAEERAKGSCLFTTLEPCYDDRVYRSHIFSSCSELLVERGIDTVVIGLIDEVISGKGIKYLRDNHLNVLVYEGLKDSIRELLIGNWKRPC